MPVAMGKAGEECDVGMSLLSPSIFLPVQMYALMTRGIGRHWPELLSVLYHVLGQNSLYFLDRFALDEADNAANGSNGARQSDEQSSTPGWTSVPVHAPHETT
jgi:hypothetical protein